MVVLLFYIFGSLIMGFVLSFVILVIGRIIFGFGIGLIMYVVFMYIVEILFS